LLDPKSEARVLERKASIFFCRGRILAKDFAIFREKTTLRDRRKD